MRRTLILILLLPVMAYSQAANQFRQVTFSNLGVPADNNVRYVVDGGVNPVTGACVGGSSGAYAFRVGSVWKCSIFAPGSGGSGDVTSSTDTSTVGQAAIFSNLTGKQIGRFSESGWVKALNGVLSAQAQLNIVTDTVGNLPVSRLNNGINASATTFWNGVGQWVEPPGIGTVLSVNASAPSGFTFTGGPITGSGTLVLNYATGQAANRFLATPNGSSGAMSLRPIAAADILPTVTVNRCLRVDSGGNIVVASNDCATGGSVNSVAMTVPNFLSVSGSPITTTGTFAVSLATQSVNQFFAGPTTGSAAAPAFRNLVAADIPSLDAGKIATGVISPSRLGTGTADASTCLRGNSTYATCGSGGTPGGSPTQIQFNNTTFGGAANFLYNSTTGQVTLNQSGNGNNALYGKRVTDSGPTGNLILFQNQAASEDLFKVDVSGNTTTNSVTMTTAGGTDGVLVVDAAVQLTSKTRPTCTVVLRGTFWYEAGATGVKDTVAVCAKAVDDSYAWRTIY